MSLRQNVFRNLAKLAFWSYSVQVKDCKAPSDPSWPRFCCLRCFFQKNIPKKFLFCKLSYFKCTTKKNVNNVCFNSRKWHLAQQKFHMSFIKKALWNNAHAGHHYPRAANNWKFYLWRWEENMYTGEGCGFFCSPKLPYLRTMIQQFCCRLSESQKWPYVL